jgi:hypothetical protein
LSYIGGDAPIVRLRNFSPRDPGEIFLQRLLHASARARAHGSKPEGRFAFVSKQFFRADPKPADSPGNGRAKPAHFAK